jgi:hypothetical protein
LEGVLPFFFLVGWSPLGAPTDEPTHSLLGVTQQSPTSRLSNLGWVIE